MKIKTNLKKIWLVIIAVLLFILLWEAAVKLFKISDFLLPGPVKVLNTYISMAASGRLFFHTWVTTVETLSGFIIGALIGIILGYLVSKSKTLNYILSPFIIAAQTTPKLALAPLFLIWFGFGIVSKIFITALVVFFPIFVNTAVAIKSINPNLKALMKLIHANRWQVFKNLELPSSLPIIFAGLKSGITLAVVGAVVGEFVGANAGLGYLIIFGTGQLDTGIVFTAIVQLVLISLIFYEIVSVVGSRLMKWHHSEKDVHY
jgi:NitT/TauT family transport system permease protein